MRVAACIVRLVLFVVLERVCCCIHLFMAVIIITQLILLKRVSL